EAQEEQMRFARRNPGKKPPLSEGDLFTSVFEGAETSNAGKARMDEDRAEVPVEHFHLEGGKMVRWTDTLVLKHVGKEWLVDNVRYGGTSKFAAKGTLRQALNKVEG